MSQEPDTHASLAALAMPTSPSGCRIRMFAVGAVRSGIEISCPNYTRTKIYIAMINGDMGFEGCLGECILVRPNSCTISRSTREQLI